MVKFYGLEGQDKFAYYLLSHIKNGFYLDICCQHWKDASNTLVFEKELNWTGLGFDIANYYPWCGPFEWDTKRRGQFIQMDVLTPEFVEVLRDNVPFETIVSYISLDIDGHKCNHGFDALQQILKAGIRFKVMTLEHEHLYYGDSVRQPSRDLLHQHGYRMMFSDVTFSDGKSFEDWWINPSFFPNDIITKYGGSYLCYNQCVERAKNYYEKNRH